MSQPYYLQQIAQRTSDRLSGLMPPRSPFQHWEAAVPLEIPEESPLLDSVAMQAVRSPVLPPPPVPQTASLANPLIQPQDPTLVSPPILDSPTTLQAERSPALPSPTTIQTASLGNPPIQLEGTTLEPSPTRLSPTNPVILHPTQVTLETSLGKETTEPRNNPSLQIESVDEDSTAIAPQALQPLTHGLPNRKPYATENPNPPRQLTGTSAPSIAEFSDALVAQPDRAVSLKEHRPPTESPPIVRWLTPTVQDSTVDKSLQESPLREISSEVTGSPIPLLAREQSPQGNTIHIGAIDIQIMPAPVAPAAIAPSPAKPVSTTPLARGFSGSFGLRQG